MSTKTTMATLPGHNIQEFFQLSELNKAGLHPMILLSSMFREKWVDVSRLKGNPVFLKKSQGSRFEVCSQSELEELGIVFPTKEMGLIVEEAQRVLKGLYPQGELSDDVIFAQLGEGFKPAEFQYSKLGNGSIVVFGSSGPMVMWTVIDGLQLLAGSEGLGLNLPSPPETRAQLESLSDTVPTEHVADSTGLLMQIKEFLLINYAIMFLNVLTHGFQQLGEILSFAGETIDTPTGAEIIIIMGVTKSVGFNYTEIVIYSMIWTLMICSWILRPIRPRISYHIAGAAITSAAIGIFCNILSPLPVPYAASAISTCIVVMLLVAFHGSRVLGRQNYG